MDNSEQEFTIKDSIDAADRVVKARAAVKEGNGDKYVLNAALQNAIKWRETVVNALRKKIKLVTTAKVIESGKAVKLIKSQGMLYLTGGKLQYYELTDGKSLLNAINCIEKTFGNKVPQWIVDAAIKEIEEAHGKS